MPERGVVIGEHRQHQRRTYRDHDAKAHEGRSRAGAASCPKQHRDSVRDGVDRANVKPGKDEQSEHRTD